MSNTAGVAIIASTGKPTSGVEIKSTGGESTVTPQPSREAITWKGEDLEWMNELITWKEGD